MATVRESDTSLWLHNKLGDNDDLWSGITSISTQLHRDVLMNAQDCFTTLHPTVKLKLLMAILHMPRRNVDECKEELSAILHQALTDSDEWVSTVADILRSYPVSGQLNLELEDSHPFLAEALHELRQTLAITDSNSLLPLECMYLNKNALHQLVGMQAPPVKHFTLKRKPKSAALRAELLQKSQEAQQQKKPSTPMSMSKIRGGFRGIDDIPLKPMSKPSSSGFRSPQSSPFNRSLPLNRGHAGRMAMQREGGTKLLDIKEQPIGGTSREAKRRKKQAEQEAQEQAKKEKEAAMQQTPDYAAALMSPAVHKPPATPTTQPAATTQPQQPSYVPTVALAKPTTPTPTLLGSLNQPPPSTATLAAREKLQQQLENSLIKQTQLRPPIVGAPAPTINLAPITAGSTGITQTPLTATPAAPSMPAATPASKNPFGVPTTLGTPGALGAPSALGASATIGAPGAIGASTTSVPSGMKAPSYGTQGMAQQSMMQPGMVQPSTVQPGMVQPGMVQPGMVQPGMVQPGMVQPGMMQPGATAPQQPMQPQQPVQPQQPPQQPAPGPKKNLSLTKDQMRAAQEMFRQSNKVTRPEKALILGFMAGARENPCPQQGNIVTIRLSEDQETVQNKDFIEQVMAVDTFFEMNYATGEWRRYKKYKPLA